LLHIFEKSFVQSYLIVDKNGGLNVSLFDED
jgi:hypothetical protein